MFLEYFATKIAYFCNIMIAKQRCFKKKESVLFDLVAKLLPDLELCFIFAPENNNICHFSIQNIDIVTKRKVLVWKVWLFENLQQAKRSLCFTTSASFGKILASVILGDVKIIARIAQNDLYRKEL